MRALEERERQLIAAHEAEDLLTLMRLYAERAHEIEENDLDAACFYMTNAYVYALVLDCPETVDFHAFLLRNQREEPYDFSGNQLSDIYGS